MLLELLALLELRVEELFDTLRLDVEPDTLRLSLLELRVVVLLDPAELLVLRLDELFDTLRLEVEPDMLRLAFELLELRVWLVLLGRSYVLPDCADLVVLLPLTERDELERLDVAGATSFTAPEPDVLRVDVLFATLRLEVEPDTLRLDVEPDTLRLLAELALATLRDEPPDTLRLSAFATALDWVLEPTFPTLRLLTDPDTDLRLDADRLRFLSHPPLTLRFDEYLGRSSYTTYVVW